MSDLRTRIAAALYRNAAKGFLELQKPWDETYPVAQWYWLDTADAVIRELGLRQETTYAWNNNESWPTATRYVTKWINK